MKNKIITTLALAGVLTLGGGGLAAFAEDAPAAPQSPPAASGAPVAQTDADAAQEPTAPVSAPISPDSVAPVLDTPADPAPVADPQPVSGAPLVAVPVTKTFSWVLPNGGTADNVTWPQPKYDPAAPIQCDTTITIQNDTGPYSTEADVAKADSFGDVLTQGEDYGWVATWNFTTVTGPACAPVIPAGQTCTVSGNPYTEDGFPLFTTDGLDHEGGSGHALNYLVPTTGNLQGFTGATMTISAASGYQTAYRFVLWQNGTSGYASVSAEPYLNGWVAGQTGVFTITPDTLVWNSKIASGPGSQSSPVTITTMAALIPNNQLISQGTHLGSTAVDGQHTTVSAITGCITYAPAAIPAPVTRQTVVTSDEVCTVNEDGTFPGGGTTTTTTTNFETDSSMDPATGAIVTGDEYQVGEPVVVTNTVAVDEACPATVVVVTPTDPGTPVKAATPRVDASILAFTGAEGVAIGLGIGALLSLVGLLLFIIKRVRRGRVA